MNNIRQIPNNFHFLTMNFVGTLLSLAVFEILILTFVIFGGVG